MADFWARQVDQFQQQFENDLREGISNQRQAELELAERVNAMSDEEFARHRHEFGLRKSLIDFLGGSE